MVVLLIVLFAAGWLLWPAGRHQFGDIGRFPAGIAIYAVFLSTVLALVAVFLAALEARGPHARSMRSTRYDASCRKISSTKG